MSWPSVGCGGEEGEVVTNCTPVETRARDPAFVTKCSLVGLQDRLPLIWPIPPDTPPSPKKAYRSHYVYQGGEDLKLPSAGNATKRGSSATRRYLRAMLAVSIYCKTS